MIMGMKVLIIDDDTFLANIYGRFLNENGCEVRVARSGEDGLRQMEREVPDLIVLDVILPEMDGFEFLDAYAFLDEELKSKVKIVMLTSSFSAIDRERANSNKYVNYFLTKPLDEEKLGQLNNI